MNTNNQSYKNNPLLKGRGVTENFTEYQIQEIIKCERNPIYFAKNYIKIISLDDGLIQFKPFKYQVNMLRLFRDNRFTISMLPRQMGKALSLDTPIPTPTGWTTMGDLSVGDDILSPDGTTTKVVWKTETMYNHDCFEVEFDTGETIVADADHLWNVRRSYWGRKEKTLTTREMYELHSGSKLTRSGTSKVSPMYIPCTKEHDFDEKELPIDPYLLGLWLGDGISRTGKICAHKDDYEFYKQFLEVKSERFEDNVAYFLVEGLTTKLNQNNLLMNKHIPDVYLRSSVHQRLELLKGLIDTDGYVTPNSRSYQFYQKDRHLCEQVQELLSTLGMKSSLTVRQIKGCNYYTVNFSSDECLVKLPRKVQRRGNSKTKRFDVNNIYIRDIRPTESVPVACISVDDPRKMFLCGNTFIPTHNSIIVCAYLIHYAIFNPTSNIAILANKASTARDLLQRLQLMYENLPSWLQVGVLSWNRGSIELENGSKILASSTSSSAVRGMSINLLFLDEFAFVENHIADDFFASVYPTITSGKKTKVIIVSTPRGLNHFYRMWTDANEGTSDYVPYRAYWWDRPGRDEEWKRQTIANTSEKQFEQEFGCSFLGSSNTLIDGKKLANLSYVRPEASNAGLDVYEYPKKKHDYIITVDVARGSGNDYSAFIVVDVTEYPHKLVAKYRNNEIKAMLFPDVICRAAKQYNSAWILVEVNDVGQQVADLLYYDHQYENLLMTSVRGRAGQVLGHGFSGQGAQMGVKMSTTVKKIGCSNFKTLVEDDKFVFQDVDLIAELTTFVLKGDTYKADDTYNDDLAMCCVIYSWCVCQEYFKEMMNQDIRKKIYEEKLEELEGDMLPFGFIDNGLGENDTEIIMDGMIWKPNEFDEYGTSNTVIDMDTQYSWWTY